MNPRTLVLILRRLLSRLRGDGYDPARHYMRGPGPRSSGPVSDPDAAGREREAGQQTHGNTGPGGVREPG
jgi:hypothetical protein